MQLNEVRLRFQGLQLKSQPRLPLGAGSRLIGVADNPEDSNPPHLRIRAKAFERVGFWCGGQCAEDSQKTQSMLLDSFRLRIHSGGSLVFNVCHGPSMKQRMLCQTSKLLPEITLPPLKLIEKYFFFLGAGKYF